MQSGQAWQRFQVRCCFAPHRLTRAAALCGPRTENILGRTGERVLLWKADTRTMNPTVPQRVIDEGTERDPASAAAEYGAQFRSDVESFVNREAVEACVSVGVRERAPLREISYLAFCDPSGGNAD